MDMDTKCSLKGNFVLFFWDCILAALAGNVADLSRVHFPQSANDKYQDKHQHTDAKIQIYSVSSQIGKSGQTEEHLSSCLQPPINSVWVPPASPWRLFLVTDCGVSVTCPFDRILNPLGEGTLGTPKEDQFDFLSWGGKAYWLWVLPSLVWPPGVYIQRNMEAIPLLWLRTWCDQPFQAPASFFPCLDGLYY